MQSIQLSFNIDEVNIILESLGDQPYAKVHQIISNIHQQAQVQLAESENTFDGSSDLPDKQEKKK